MMQRIQIFSTSKKFILLLACWIKWY